MKDLTLGEKALLIAIDIVPIALGLAIIVALLNFFNIPVPFMQDLTDKVGTLKRSMGEMDVMMLANTVQLALDKYDELFPED